MYIPFRFDHAIEVPFAIMLLHTTWALLASLVLLAIVLTVNFVFPQSFWGDHGHGGIDLKAAVAGPEEEKEQVRSELEEFVNTKYCILVAFGWA